MATPSRLVRGAIAILASCAWAALAWRFDWLCDDAFISFRYAKNLALGRGLVFNPGESPPVEGYTNFLWTLWLAPFARAGVDLTIASRVSSAACALALLALLYRHLRARFGPDSWAPPLALLFLAALPPFAVWSTSGLETLPFTLAVFATYERLLGDPERPRGVQAAFGACVASLLRADGILWIGMVVACGLALGARARSRPLLRASLAAGAAAALLVAAHVAWRHGYYGSFVPNTARVKVDPDAISLERGLKYVGSFLAAFPSVPIALISWIALIAFAPARAARDAGRSRASVAPAAIVLGNVVYVVMLGGDFMAMGRFLVPSLPFVALLFALALDQLERARRGTALAIALATAASATSLLTAYDRSVVPLAVRERLAFRWSADRYRSEYEQWEIMWSQALEWSVLGRALRQYTHPGESLIHGTIGAVGYYSELVIHDPFGLVNREGFQEESVRERRSPGHHRRIPMETFYALKPTYLEAQLVPKDSPDYHLPQHLVIGPMRNHYESSYFSLDSVPGAPPGWKLRISRPRP